jgi:hypothetical protein
MISLPLKVISDKESTYLNKTLRKLHIVHNLFQTLSVLLKYGAVSIMCILSIAYMVALCVKLFDLSSLSNHVTTTVLSTLYTFIISVTIIVSVFMLIVGEIARPSSILYWNRNLTRKTRLTRSVFGRLHRAYSMNIHKHTFVKETTVMAALSCVHTYAHVREQSTMSLHRLPQF